jgi:transposase
MVEDRKRSQAFDAAPGELREEIERAAKKYGATVVKVKFDTETCHACHRLCEFERAKHLRHECEHCGVTWDQDHNACRNALRERSGDGETPGGARKKSKPKKSLAKRDSGRGQVTAAE